jgi:hypothetical protein
VNDDSKQWSKLLQATYDERGKQMSKVHIDLNGKPISALKQGAGESIKP